MSGGAPVARLSGVGLRYGARHALAEVAVEIPAGRVVGLIGPDGVGKSSLLSLVAGARRVQEGHVEVLGGDIADPAHRARVCPRIAYMPQGLGRNIYPTLSVFENIDFFARLFGQAEEERRTRIGELLAATGLAPFASRAAGHLSGGMKQKLGLCCALIHDPDLLILDEPTTGVDPLSRRQFWELIGRIRAGRPGLSVMVATAYMEEAARFDWLLAMDAGRVLATGAPAELQRQTGAESLEAVFIALLPEEKRRAHKPVHIPPRPAGEAEIAIEAKGLTRRFGDFVAVDHVDFRIERGEIFGFIGSNGCGKTTTMKMLTGLLPATEGQARLFGREVDANDIQVRRRVGYMSQSFSLYSELTVRQNLVLHAKLFQLPAARIAGRVEEMSRRFELTGLMDALPGNLPLGQRQRLSLAVAMIHGPDMLILDEPTSGVDPVARDAFWQSLADLSRQDRVTIFISTHFMNEAARCDRVALMHAGRVLVIGSAAKLMAARGAATLEDAFIGYLEDAAKETGPVESAAVAPIADPPAVPPRTPGRFNPRRMFSYSRREALELRRDPIRLTLALLGSVVLMLVMGFGVSLDVQNLTFAVLDHDQTTTSSDYALNIAGSPYFIERPPLRDYAELDRRMRDGELALAIELPPHFARDIERGDPVSVGAWIDGAMPMRAETVKAYMEAIQAQWLAQKEAEMPGGTPPAGLFDLEIRYRYNPDVVSIVAMVPAMLPLLLLLIPAMLTALSVVREKELGSIINFYVTPVTRLEFLLGKQLPYIVLAMVNFLLLFLLAVTLFGVPLKGGFLALTFGALLYVTCATAIGLLISIFMNSQIAAIFGTAVLSIIPAIQFSGMIDPVSSLQGMGRVIGEVYPATHFLDISRGTFSKALYFRDLYGSFWPLAVTIPVLLGASVFFLKKQER